MRRGIRITLIVLGSIIVLLIILAYAGWNYLNRSFLDFEKDYIEARVFPELSEKEYAYLDRNRNGELDIYEDDRQPMQARVADLLQQMTIEEKIHLLKGAGLASAMGRIEPGTGIAGAVGTIVPTPRLGIPTIYLSDGPAGLRIQPSREGTSQTYYCTAFPIGTMLASTWNTDLVEEVGRAMGREAEEYGIDVILGPGANIHRHPFCGRNFEYYSEDPALTGYIGAAMVNGIESNGVGTSVKHYVANNQETDRFKNDVRVSERALREIYLKGFELIIRHSQPWTIMSSYNKVNGTYTSQSRRLLTDILRGEWAFTGLVMSDWFGGRDATAQIMAGNDLLEPGTKQQWKALEEGYKSGRLTLEAVDTSVSRILRLILRSHKMKGNAYGNNPDLQAHAAITRRSAAEGMVLLKNEKVLPMAQSTRVALLGVTSFDFIAGGTGSGDVNEAYTVSLEQGLSQAGVQISAAATELFATHRSRHEEEFIKPEGFQAMFTPYDPPEIEYSDAQLRQMANDADIAILTIGRNSGEGGDRTEVDDWLLSDQEQDMLTRICDAFHAAGKPVVVVLNIGGVIETATWRDQPDAILLAWQGGQEGGSATADVLTGQVNPSGKLPMTFPLRLEDHASSANFPLDGEPMRIMDLIMRVPEQVPEAKQVRNKDYTNYEESIYVGYRHFDKAGLDVSYPFGHGLSYTLFEFTNLTVDKSGDSVIVRVTVTNSGDRAGKEVVQLYVAKPVSAVDRPMHELKAFAKTTTLQPGDMEEVMLRIPLSELRYWDEAKDGWVLERGMYLVKVGTSSRDVRLAYEVEL